MSANALKTWADFRLSGTIAALFTLVLASCGPASPPAQPATTTSVPPGASVSQTSTEPVKFGAQRPSESAISELSPIIPAESKPKWSLLAADVLEREGLHSLPSGPFVFISDLEPARLQALAEVVSQLETTWDKTFGRLDDLPRWTAFLIDEPAAFERLGLAPPGELSLRHGLQFEDRLWLRVQDNDDAARQLFIHEATHARMMANSTAQSPGTLWFHEGVAEWLATHAKDPINGEITLKIWPTDTQMLKGWSHFRHLQAANRAGEVPSLPRILNFQEADFVQDGQQAYANCWALCQFLSRHPKYRDSFQDCLQADDWDEVLSRLNKPLLADQLVCLEWLAWLAQIGPQGDDIVPVVPLTSHSTSSDEFRLVPQSSQTWMSVAESEGSSRLVQVRAEGKIRVQAGERDVISGPLGVTVRYRLGFPVGALLAVVVAMDGGASDAIASSPGNPFAHPQAVGKESLVNVPAGHMLLLSINQFPQKPIVDEESLQIRLTDQQQ